MLSARVIRSGAGYAERHLRYSDYLDEQNRVQGFWTGLGAEQLGVRGEVTDEGFERLRQGQDPATGERLRPRVLEEGAGRSLYDVVMSPPKSVSGAVLVGGDERLLGAVHQAEGVAFSEFEAAAETRVRRGGRQENRVTGNLICAVFRHDASRSLDPQLHSHYIIGNLTFDPVENRWKALQARSMYERLPYVTEVYRNALAAEARALGYHVESAKDARGKHLGFELSQVRWMNERFSQRSVERDEAIALFVAERGREPTKNEIAVLVRNSRADKLTEISKDEVRARQRAKLTQEEWGSLSRTISQARAVAPRLAQENARLADEILLHAEESVFERVSVASRYDVLTTSLRYSLGRVSLEEIKGAFSRALEGGRFIVAGDMLSTAKALARERELIAEVDAGQSTRRAIAQVDPRFLPAELSVGQREAVAGVLGSRDRISALQGAAGTGKTTVLEHVRKQAEQNGYEVLAVAPTVSAVAELSKAGFPKATTISRLLVDTTLHSKSDRRLLLVDEAAMVGSKTLHAILTGPAAAFGRVLLVGDTRQLHSVDAGDAMRLLQRESTLKTVQLEQIFRQRGALKKALERLRHDPMGGFDDLIALGAVRQTSPETVLDDAVEQYVKWDLDSRRGAKGSTMLAVVPTWAEIEAFTGRVRDRLRGAGTVGSGISIRRLKPLNWTIGDKKQIEAYRAGHVLVFHKGTKEVGKDEAVTVTGVKNGRIQATRANGQTVTLTGKQAKAFGVFAGEIIDVALGDRLLLQGNRRAPKRTPSKSGPLAARLGWKPFSAKNGELVTVKSVSLREGLIRLSDGRVIPKDYRQLVHGYAVTTYASQGKTVDRVMVLGARMSHEHFYVSATRARDTVAVYTPDRERFADSLQQSSARPSAMDLERSSERDAHRSWSTSRSQQPTGDQGRSVRVGGR